MRLVAVTILPMLAAAILVMVVGEQFSQRTDETRSPHDRERLLDFSAAFRDELNRLDALYESHLERISTAALSETSLVLKPLAKEVTAIQSISVFRASGSDLKVVLPIRTIDLPEISLTGRKLPLNPQLAVILDKKLLSAPLPVNGAWQKAPDGRHVVHYRQPEPGTLVAVLIDFPVLQNCVDAHLTQWLPHPTLPIAEANEQVSLTSPTRKTLASFGASNDGIVAAIIPERTLFGDFELRAWDTVAISTSHDSATLALTTTLATLLIASGVFLYFQQLRSLRLATQRVSFVNRVSHELGTPLTNLSLNLDLTTNLFETRPTEARKRLDLVVEEVSRLSRLVKNVLTFSHRERDNLTVQPSPCQPDEIAAKVFETFRPSLARHGIDCDVSLAKTSNLLLDPDAFSQILANLLSNVEKYAATGRWLGLSLREEKDRLILEVSDRGPGIPARARQRVFQPFERVHQDTSEGVSGTGLGLTIAQELASRMSGELVLLDNSPGCTFRLNLPAESSFVVLPTSHQVA